MEAENSCQHAHNSIGLVVSVVVVRQILFPAHLFECLRHAQWEAPPQEHPGQQLLLSKDKVLLWTAVEGMGSAQRQDNTHVSGALSGLVLHILALGCWIS